MDTFCINAYINGLVDVWVNEWEDGCIVDISVCGWVDG